MNTKFNKAFEELIGVEGGYVFDPLDKGGETKYGITKRTYPHLDIKSLSLQDAKDIYYKDFWNTSRMNLDDFEYELAYELFDTGVNAGMGTARRMLQRALNLLNRVETFYDDLKVDGWIGSVSMRAISKVRKPKLIKVLNGLQFMHYYNIVDDDHTQERFFAGWIERT